MTVPAAPPRIQTDDREPGRLRLTGRWTLRYATAIGECLASAPTTISAIDASGVERIDSLGVLELKRFAQRRQMGLEDFEFREDHRALVAAIWFMQVGW